MRSRPPRNRLPDRRADGVNAFAIDAMLPALPAIGRAPRRRRRTAASWSSSSTCSASASAQIAVGPLADRFGRKPILAVGVALYAASRLLCGLAASFDLLIAGRVAMGASAAVTRVLVVAMVRDRFDGGDGAGHEPGVHDLHAGADARAQSRPGDPARRRLARDLPRCSPSTRGDAGCGAACACPRRCIPSSAGRSPAGRLPARRGASGRVDRLSLGNTLAMTAIFGGLTAYIASIQQIVFDVFTGAA